MLSTHLTDRAITVGHEMSPSKLVVHYLQPHAPYIANALSQEREMTDLEKNPFDYLLKSKIGRDTVWDLYLDDLRLGLDNIQRLLESIGAQKAVITADHGEAFGENGFYRHPSGCPPVLKRVPWVETTARDSGEYEPEFSYEEDSVEQDVEDQLAQLGYL